MSNQMSIAMFSQIHKNQNINLSRMYNNVDISYMYKSYENNEEIETTAIFIPEMLWKAGYSELNESTVKDYLTTNQYYLYPDMEFRGIVGKCIKTNKL